MTEIPFSSVEPPRMRMRDLTMRGLRSRARRSAAIVVAVLLGVGLMVGGLVLTDTINASFDEIFAEGRSGDVIIRAEQGVDQRGPGGGGVNSFPVSVLEEVRATPGVEAAQGGIFNAGTLLDERGDRLGSGFAPSFIFSAYDERFESLEYEKGRPPRGSGEVALDAASARRAGVRRGDRIHVVAKKEPSRYEVVGLTRLGDVSFGGASFATLSLSEAKRVTGRVGRLNRIEAAGGPGLAPEELADRLARRLPGKLEISTAQADAQSQLADIKEGLGFLTVVLAVFGFVSLFVGSFVIFNTFAITVTQRIVEFGLLRTLGASRRQVLTAVMLEAGVVGVVGSVAGCIAGVLFSFGIQALFRAFGLDLPNSGTVIAPRTMLVGFGLGMLMTLLSALVPALRATRVPPMAALRTEGVALEGGRGRAVLAAALILAAGGLAVLLTGLFGDFRESGDQAVRLGAGAVAVLLGVALLSPRLVGPVAAAVGRPLERLRGITGRLARENAVRRPGRTAATAAALMIGLGLVSFVAIVAAGFNASVAATIEENFAGELIVQNLDGLSPIPRATLGAAREVNGVRTVSPSAYANAEVRGVEGEPYMSSLDPATADEVLTLDWVDGDQRTLARLEDDEVLVDDSWARSKGFATGDEIEVRTASGERHGYEIAGSIVDNAELFGAFIVSDRAMRSDFGIDQPAYAFVGLRPRARPRDVQWELKQVLRDRFPSAAVRNQRQLGEQQAEQIGRLTVLIYALLSLAVLVSLFGIANTLSLSILERTRELGMLRAIGTLRHQVREMVTLEAVITALIGAVLGLALGIGFAALMSQALAGLGFVFVLPAVQLAVMFGAAALAGALASVGPARRAADIDLLEAVAYE